MFIVWWLRFCDQVVANSGYTASLAKEKAGQKNRLPSFIRACTGTICDPMAIDALELEPGLQGKRIILFVGRLARRKGVKEFVDKSLGRIIQELPESIPYCWRQSKRFSNSRDDVRSESSTRFRQASEEHVQWLGALSDEDLIKVYNLCDVVVLPICK